MTLRAYFFSAFVACSLAATGVSFAQNSQSTTLVPDVPSGTSMLLPNGWHLTPAGRSIPLPGDMPLKMMVSPDGKQLIVNTGGFHDHGVSLIDLGMQSLTQTAPVAADWAGMALSPDGGTLYVAAGNGGGGRRRNAAPRPSKTLLRFGYAQGALTQQTDLAVPSLSGRGHWTAGVAADPAGNLYVADIDGDAVHKLAAPDLATETVATVGYHPYAVVLSPDGKTLAVSNWGDQSVSLLDPNTMTETVRVPVGQHPNEMAFGPDGRLFVANAGSNSVSVIAFPTAGTGAGAHVVETIKTSLTPNALVGSTPDAVAVSPNGKTLYVANADNNDVAMIDVSHPGDSQILGFIPTGWYPSALAVALDDKTLYIGTGKGFTFRANFPALTADPENDGGSPVKSDYIPNLLNGAVSVVAVPDAKTLAEYTHEVRADVPVPNLHLSAAKIVAAKSAFSKIKHVLFIIRENRTYDQVFGDIKTGNGDPNLTFFGQAVTPNVHRLATQTVLLDNLYCNGEVSEDGHQWCDAAYATDFTEKAWIDSYSNRGEPDADERLTASPAGYLWDDCRRHGLTYRSYGEFARFKSSPDAPPVFAGSKGLEGHACEAWSQLPFGQRRDTERAAIFIQELRAAEKTGAWPNFMVMALGEDHTQGLRAGAYTPVAAVASNDQAVGQIVAAVSHSKFWKNTAIFVIEDDAQNGADHIDAHRTVGLVISPYVRRGVADHTMYSTASFVRTMEMMLGLPPMTQFDEAATPLYNSFAATPVLTAFDPMPAQVDLEAKNPGTGDGAEASAKLDFSAPDRADPDALNAILWRALRPGKPQPAPVRSVASLP